MIEKSNVIRTEPDKASTVLSTYYDKWLERTLAECVGNEWPCLLAILRTADLHALRLTNRHMMQKPEMAVSSNICNGVRVLLPELMSRVKFPANLKLQQSSSKLALWAANKLEQAGALGVAKRIAMVEQYGLSECTFAAANKIVIRRVLKEDAEAQENSDRNWINEWEKKQATAQWIKVSRDWITSRANISLKFNDLSSGKMIMPSPNGTFFQSVLSLQNLHEAEYAEADSFPDHATFGPLTFGQWKKIAACIAALMAVNVEYVLHVERTEHLRDLGKLNLCSRFLDEAKFIEFLHNWDHTIIRTQIPEILDVFTADPTDSERFLGRQDLPAPMLIKVPGGYLFSHSAALGNPYWYLVDKIKARYNKHWKLNSADVKVLETAFQEDLYSLFSSSAYAVGKANLKLKRVDGTEGTDIDATLFERDTNTIYLFQLKWPEVYAGDWRPRESQYSNLRKAGEKWVDEVYNWVERSRADSLPDMLTRLELREEVRDYKNVDFKLIVLSRRWTQFSGKSAYDDRAGWISWARLRKLMITSQNPRAKLNDAWTEITNPRPRRYIPGEPRATRLPGLTIFF